MLARLWNLQTCLLDAELSVAHQKYAALAAEVRCLEGGRKGALLARLYNLQTCLLDAELSVVHQKYAVLAAEVRC